MSDIGKYVPLKTVVAYFLDEFDKSDGDRDKCWILAFRGMVDIGLDISFEPKTIRIPLNGNQTATLPSDYIGWTKIGILDNHQQVSTLKINNALTTFRDNNPNRLSQLTPDVSNSIPLLAGYPYFLNFYNNGIYNNLFGVGGGLQQFGECRVDERNNVIVFPADFRYDSVILEYISSPEKDEDYMVETVLQEAIIAFIGWKMRVKPEESYYTEQIKARRRLPNKKFTLQTFNQVIRESTGQYLKA